jgi:hypothetical protein
VLQFDHAAGNGIILSALIWMLVAAPLGIVNAYATVTELARLSNDKQGKIRQFRKVLETPRFASVPAQALSA